MKDSGLLALFAPVSDSDESNYRDTSLMRKRTPS